MMTTNYAELTLYFAFTSTFSHDLGTGKFSPQDIYYSSAEKRRIAMDHVHRAMDLKLLKYGVGGCLRDEERAATLIGYAEREIAGAHGLIELYDCSHGAVRFYRKLLFPYFREDRREELLRIIRNSKQIFEKYSNSLENSLHFLTE